MLRRHRPGDAPHQEKPGDFCWRCPGSDTTLGFIVEQLLTTKSRNAILLERGGELALAGLPELDSIEGRVRPGLIAVIEDMVDGEPEALDADQAYLAATSEADRAAHDRADPDFNANADDFAGLFSNWPLLDEAPIVEVGKAYDPSTGSWYRVEEGYPVCLPVTAEELGDLSELRRLMERDLGIAFYIARVFWTEDALMIPSLDDEDRRRIHAGGRRVPNLPIGTASSRPMAGSARVPAHARHADSAPR